MCFFTKCVLFVSGLHGKTSLSMIIANTGYHWSSYAMVSAITSIHLTVACCTLSHALGLKNCDNPSLCVSNLQQYLTGGDYDDVEDLEEKLAAYKSKIILCRVTPLQCDSCAVWSAKHVSHAWVMCASCIHRAVHGFWRGQFRGYW